MQRKRFCSACSLALAIFAVVAVWMTVALPPSAHAQTYKVIYNFTGGADGGSPQAGLTIDRTGNLYGTTFQGGTGFGTVFKLTHLRSGWIFAPLYRFAGGPNDGAGPAARVVFGPGGSLYGTTGGGGETCPGDPYNGCGTVFKLSPLATACGTVQCIWLETVLYRFTGQMDGGYPASGDLVFDHASNIYGAALTGGLGHGVVYELMPSHPDWRESVLYDGDQSGGFPPNGVIFDNSGNLYGTGQEGGGSGGLGTVFELTPSGSAWRLNVLHVFQDPMYGTSPFAGVIFDNSGNLYGTTVSDGSGHGGTVFELSPSNGQWTITLLYALVGNGGSEASLVMDGAGNLYGTTFFDGAFGDGSVFKLTHHQDGTWTYSDLHDFSGGSDGGFPLGGVIVDSNGNLYGTASFGGADGQGVVFEITP